jgi:hypothetical protein
LKDSNSIVALSVSISARISPSATVSYFFNQVATVPSVIVSQTRHRYYHYSFGKEVATEDDSLVVSGTATASEVGLLCLQLGCLCWFPEVMPKYPLLLFYNC